MSDPHAALAGRFQRARKDPGRAVLEGFHALKHALRFGAQVELVVAADAAALAQIADDLAPDLHRRLGAIAVEQVPPDLLSRLAPRVPHTKVLALAARPPFDGDRLRRDRTTGAIVLLEDPRDLGNIGAVIRAAAAAGAGAVVTTGTHDPWDAAAIRGATGLHFAIAVGRDDAFPADHGDRPLLALDPDGELLDPTRLPPDAVLAFGTERDGLSDDLLARADARLRLPMRPGVSSLNLATSVAAVLFAWRLMMYRGDV